MWIAESKSLFLREFLPEDVHGMYALNADPDVLKYTGDRPFASLEEASLFLETYDAYRRHRLGRWTVIRKTDKAFLGWCGLKKHESGMVDLGYRLMQQYWGMGYATEAAALSLAHGFEVHGLEEIVARTHPENHSSARVAEKLGMRLVGQEAVEGLGQALMFRITRSEWLAQTNKKGSQ